jgi:hypothetical protein
MRALRCFGELVKRHAIERRGVQNLDLPLAAQAEPPRHRARGQHLISSHDQRVDPGAVQRAHQLLNSGAHRVGEAGEPDPSQVRGQRILRLRSRPIILPEGEAEHAQRVLGHLGVRARNGRARLGREFAPLPVL